MKKKIAIILAAVMLLAMMSGCGATSTAPSASAPAAADGAQAEDNSLTVWCWDESFNIPAMQTAGEYYAQTHPGFTVNVVNTTEEDVKAKCIAAFSANSTDGLPDIILVGDSWANAFLNDYYGMFVDLSKDIDYNQFASYKTNCFTIGDEIFGVPFDSGSAGMFYRTDVLEEAGIDPSELENITWAKMVELAAQVKNETGKYAFNFLPSACGFVMFQGMLQSAGTWFYDENQVADFVNNAAIREIFETVKGLCDTNAVYLTDTRDADGIAKVQNGEVAFVMNAVWYSPTIAGNPDASGLWDYTNIPMLTVPGATKYTNIGGSSWVVLNTSAKQALAVDFMKEIFAGNIEYYDEVLLNNGVVATYLPAAESNAYAESSEFFCGKPLYSDFASWNANIPAVNYGTNTWTAIDALQSVIQDYVDGSMTLDEALEAAQTNYDMQVG